MKGFSSLIAVAAIIAAVSVSVIGTSYMMSKGYLKLGTTTTTLPSRVVQIIETTTTIPEFTTTTFPELTTTTPFMTEETTTILSETTISQTTTRRETTTFPELTTIMTSYEEGTEKCCNDVDDDGDLLENGYDPDCQIDINLIAGQNQICWRTEWNPYNNNRDYYSGWFKCPDGYVANQANMTWELADGDCLYVYGKDSETRVEICGSENPTTPPSQGTQWVRFRFVSDSSDTRTGAEVQWIECKLSETTETTSTTTLVTTVPGDTTTSTSTTTTTTTTTSIPTSCASLGENCTGRPCCPGIICGGGICVITTSTTTSTSTTSSSSTTTYSTSSTTTSSSSTTTIYIPTTTIFTACGQEGARCGLGYPSCCSDLFCTYFATEYGTEGYCLEEGYCPILRVYNGKEFVDVEKLNIHAPENQDTIATSTFFMQSINGKYELILHEAAYLFWDGSHIDSVKLTDAAGKECKLLSATHSKHGDVLSAIEKSDDIRVRTFPEEEIKLVYEGCSGNKFTFSIEGYNRKVLGFDLAINVVLYALIVVIILGITFSIIDIIVKKNRLLKT